MILDTLLLKKGDFINLFLFQAATQQLLVCDQKRREQLEKEKKRFKNLFSKLNDDDKGQPQAEVGKRRHIF